jgi:hypothetical protein
MDDLGYPHELGSLHMLNSRWWSKKKVWPGPLRSCEIARVVGYSIWGTERPKNCGTGLRMLLGRYKVIFTSSSPHFSKCPFVLSISFGWVWSQGSHGTFSWFKTSFCPGCWTSLRFLLFTIPK